MISSWLALFDEMYPRVEVKEINVVLFETRSFHGGIERT